MLQLALIDVDQEFDPQFWQIWDTDHAVQMQTSLSSSDFVLLFHPTGCLIKSISSHDQSNIFIFQILEFRQDPFGDHRRKIAKVHDQTTNDLLKQKYLRKANAVGMELNPGD